eukprot:5302855-Amphidinium_carterae.1
MMNCPSVCNSPSHPCRTKAFLVRLLISRFCHIHASTLLLRVVYQFTTKPKKTNNVMIDCGVIAGAEVQQTMSKKTRKKTTAEPSLSKLSPSIREA